MQEQHPTLSTVAAACGSMALLVGVAVFISASSGTAQLAAVENAQQTATSTKPMPHISLTGVDKDGITLAIEARGLYPKRAISINPEWVGGTEKLIANAEKKAKGWRFYYSMYDQTPGSPSITFGNTLLRLSAQLATVPAVPFDLDFIESLRPGKYYFAVEAFSNEGGYRAQAGFPIVVQGSL